MLIAAPGADAEARAGAGTTPAIAALIAPPEGAGVCSAALPPTFRQRGLALGIFCLRDRQRQMTPPVSSTLSTGDFRPHRQGLLLRRPAAGTGGAPFRQPSARAN